MITFALDLYVMWMMENIDVVEIRCKRDMDNFIRLPYFIYQNCIQYVPDLESDIRNLFDRHKNPAYEFSLIQPFVAYRHEVALLRQQGKNARCLHRLYSLSIPRRQPFVSYAWTNGPAIMSTTILSRAKYKRKSV